MEISIFIAAAAAAAVIILLLFVLLFRQKKDISSKKTKQYSTKSIDHRRTDSSKDKAHSPSVLPAKKSTEEYTGDPE